MIRVQTAQASPMVVFVLGMGRSGSSALARALSLCGAALPDALLGANSGNPLGHWEPQHAIDLNDSILAQHGANWYDPTLRLQTEVTLQETRKAAYLDRIAAFLSSLPAAPLLVIKEPRITSLGNLWLEAARRTGFSIGVVIPVRHPAEVVASLAARDGASPELSSALWLKYNLLGERESRPYLRAFVDYASLLRDWRAEISRIGATLSVDLGFRNAAAVDEFLRQDLHRQRHRDAISEVFGPGWISRVYGVLAAAARAEPVETAVLDEIFESYRSCEHAFRVAVADFRSRLAVQTHRNPHIARLICAVAGAHSQTLRTCIDSAWYREHNPDVFAAGCDPYEHWMAYGSAEGRLPCEDPLSLLNMLMRERTSPSTASVRTQAR